MELTISEIYDPFSPGYQIDVMFHRNLHHLIDLLRLDLGHEGLLELINVSIPHLKDDYARYEDEFSDMIESMSPSIEIHFVSKDPVEIYNKCLVTMTICTHQLNELKSYIYANRESIYELGAEYEPYTAGLRLAYVRYFQTAVRSSLLLAAYRTYVSLGYAPAPEDLGVSVANPGFVGASFDFGIVIKALHQVLEENRATPKRVWSNNDIFKATEAYISRNYKDLGLDDSKGYSFSSLLRILKRDLHLHTPEGYHGGKYPHWQRTVATLRQKLPYLFDDAPESVESVVALIKPTVSPDFTNAASTASD